MMKYASAFLLLLLPAHCVLGLSPVPQRPTSLSYSRTASSSSSSSSISDYRRPASSLAYSSAAHRNNNISGDTRLFSAAAAVSADGAYSNEASSDINVKYGPAFKIGKLKINLFGAIFGMWEIFWGVVFWYPSMALYTLLQAMSSKLPGNIMQKIDPFRRMPICIAYAWGLLSFTLFGLWPKVEGRENLELLREVDENGKKGKLQSAMYVANHCSWMDIPFVCRVFGFRNCKIIAKAELGKVPILGRALRVGGHVILDRTNRRSQMAAYKGGVQCLKDGVNLVTFPEGTRSKTSRLGPFKKGAFKMAQSVGAPVVPMSIHYAHKIQPCDYAFPAKSARIGRPRAVIKIGKPISTDGKSDDELLEEVWGSIAGELPESQKPSLDTPAGV